MFRRMIEGLIGVNAATADAVAKAPPPAFPETVQLEAGVGVRIILPPGKDGFASLVNSNQGLFIINRHDGGVGWQLRIYQAYDAEQMRALELMARAVAPDPVILDIGANIGVAALVLARAAGQRGLVRAFEAQRAMFHKLAGNMALNSADNVHCYHTAVGAAAGTAKLPRMDYRRAASFGSVELNREQQSDAHQQAADGIFDDVPQLCIDDLRLPRVDLMKIDVEGMEADAPAGALETLRTHRPAGLRRIRQERQGRFVAYPRCARPSAVRRARQFHLSGRVAAC